MLMRIEKAASPAAQRLIEQLNADLMARYPGAPVFGIDAVQFEAVGGVFVIGYEGGEAVASGAIRPFERFAEIKRVYVLPAFRGRGYARAMMAFLEAEAVRRGFTHGVLETGSGQPEAIALYRSLGWSEIPPFGIYAGTHGDACFNAASDFRHVCFEKCLAASEACAPDAEPPS
jgi:ribosomal protein S18 acetylase RimI-like enzyme